MGGINIKPMEPTLLTSCMSLVAKVRAEAHERDIARQIEAYAAAKAVRKPWLSLPEAAAELDVTPARISQLISEGTFTFRYHPIRSKGAPKQVLAADVLAYTPNPIKKTRNKK